MIDLVLENAQQRAVQGGELALRAHGPYGTRQERAGQAATLTGQHRHSRLRQQATRRAAQRPRGAPPQAGGDHGGGEGRGTTRQQRQRGAQAAGARRGAHKTDAARKWRSRSINPPLDRRRALWRLDECAHPSPRIAGAARRRAPALLRPSEPSAAACVGGGGWSAGVGLLPPGWPARRCARALRCLSCA